MQKKSVANAWLAALCLSFISLPALSKEAFVVDASMVEEAVDASLVEDIGAQERINLSGKLRMLSQRIASSACHFWEGVDVEATSAMMLSSTEEFDKILTALEFGNEEMNIIGSEKRRKTLFKIEKVKEQWAPIKAAVLHLAEHPDAEADLIIIQKQNLELLKRSASLVSELVGQYSNPAEMVQADSMVIDIAGRQRMLIQKMSKESCLMASHHENEDTRENLKGTMNLFEVTLKALTSGMPAAGVKPPPTSEIASGLELVNREWEEVKPMLEVILSGAEVDHDFEADKFHKLNELMSDMNKVVGMYARYAKKD